jgi:uncharacterized DUF497 family protein
MYTQNNKIFTWNEKKNETNFEKHGITFESAIDIFEGFVLTHVDARKDYKETRLISIGRIEDIIMVTVVHTARGKTTRIISARRASRKERKLYEKAYAQRIEKTGGHA